MRPRFSYANVSSTLALVLAVGTGGAWAATQIDGDLLKARTITGGKLKADTLTSREVNESKLGQVPNAKRFANLPVTAFTQGGGTLTAGHATGTAGTGTVKVFATPVGEYRLRCTAAAAFVDYRNTTPGDALIFSTKEETSEESRVSALLKVSAGDTRDLGEAVDLRTGVIELSVGKTPDDSARLKVHLFHGTDTATSPACVFIWELLVSP